MFEHIEAVVAHEYFHNWTGNRITCRDWFQLCLKEGLTVFRDQEFSADERSATVQRIADVRQLRTQQFAEDAGPLAHPVRPETYIEINNFYTATVYEKGAGGAHDPDHPRPGAVSARHGSLLRAARRPGRDRRGVPACLSRCPGATLAVQALVRPGGTPELVCSLAYDRAAKSAELRVEQVLPRTPAAPARRPMHIPCGLGSSAPTVRTSN